MAVDLRLLSQKLPYPEPPRKWLWLVIAIVLMILFAVILLIVVPELFKGGQVWFWTVIILVPLSLVGLVFGIRMLLYEQRYEYIAGWNLQYDESEQELTLIGQKSVQCMEWTYIVDNISYGLSQFAINHHQLIRTQQYSAEQTGSFTRIECLVGDLETRLAKAFISLFMTLNDRLAQMSTHQSCQLLLSINCKNITESKVEELFNRVIHTNDDMTKKMMFKVNDSGLSFIDDWLDKEQPKIIIYADINLNNPPLNNSAEFASLLILTNDPLEQVKQNNKLIKIHRPVRWNTNDESLEYALTTALAWGELEAKDIGSIWLSGLTDEYKSELLIIMDKLKFKAKVSDVYDVDQIIGKAVNNATSALIPAMEHAKQTQLPQLVINQNRYLEILVVKAINHNSNNN